MITSYTTRCDLTKAARTVSPPEGAAAPMNQAREAHTRRGDGRGSAPQYPGLSIGQVRSRERPGGEGQLPWCGPPAISPTRNCNHPRYRNPGTGRPSSQPGRGDGGGGSARLAWLALLRSDHELHPLLVLTDLDVEHLVVEDRYNFLYCSSRPALRAAACGGRPRPARPDGHRRTGLALRTRPAMADTLNADTLT
jgi:hypothetical protein